MFKLVQKKFNGGTSHLRDNCLRINTHDMSISVRVNKKSVTISQNIADKFQIGRTTNDQGHEVVKLGLSVDLEAKMIRIDPQSLNGFTFSCKTAGTNNLYLAKPSSLRKIDLPMGDYLVSNEANLEFTLAE